MTPVLSVGFYELQSNKHPANVRPISWKIFDSTTPSVRKRRWCGGLNLGERYEFDIIIGRFRGLQLLAGITWPGLLYGHPVGVVIVKESSFGGMAADDIIPLGWIDDHPVEAR